MNRNIGRARGIAVPAAVALLLAGAACKRDNDKSKSGVTSAEAGEPVATSMLVGPENISIVKTS